MADLPSPSAPPESGRPSGGHDPSSSAQTTIFLTDPSAEAERVAQALRSAGYQVVDVPLSLLVARASVQRPAMVLIDVDADGAREVVGRMREIPGAASVEVLFFGEAKRTVRDLAEAIAAGASGFFDRPLDIGSVARKVESLAPVNIRGEEHEPGLTPPPSLPSSRLRPQTSDPAPEPHVTGPIPEAIAPQIMQAAAAMELAPISSSAPPGVNSSLPSPPSIAPSSLLDGSLENAAWSGGPGSLGAGTSLSEELQRVLASAEERVGSNLHVSSQPPSPDDEVDAVLPADLLAALDEPVGFEEEDSEGSQSIWSGTSTPSRTGTTGSRAATAAGGTHGGTHAGGALTTGVGDARDGNAEPSRPPELASDPPAPFPSVPPMETPTPLPPRPRSASASAPPSTSEPEPVTPRPPRGRGAQDTPVPLELDETRSLAGPPTTAGEWQQPPRREATSADRLVTPLPRKDSVPPPTTAQRGRESAPPPALPESVALVDGESVRVLARAASDRLTGSLCFDDGQGLRRVVMRDGDFITAGSSFEDETLVAFLAGRGELPKDVAKRLAGRLAPFGRHAGAALIAHGHLSQDRLWEILRGHAEWIVGKIALLDRGACIYEGEPPGRLRAEPSVFGGSTGAEVLVEVVRRVVPSTVAIERMGGSRARLGEGQRRQMLAECALSETEREIVDRAPGQTVAEIVESSRSPEIASVLMALAGLGVLEVLAPSEGQSNLPPPQSDPLDEEAFRARVRARLDLVEEGDYFAVLGVAKRATPYEIRRAYLDLRHSFEPGRVLTGKTADLVDDVQTILEVLDEAYEILRDPTRRERYRRAIEAPPS